MASLDTHNSPLSFVAPHSTLKKRHAAASPAKMPYFSCNGKRSTLLDPPRSYGVRFLLPLLETVSLSLPIIETLKSTSLNLKNPSSRFFLPTEGFCSCSSSCPSLLLFLPPSFLAVSPRCIVVLPRERLNSFIFSSRESICCKQ